jgi:hypothetical protein
VIVAKRRFPYHILLHYVVQHNIYSETSISRFPGSNVISVVSEQILFCLTHESIAFSCPSFFFRTPDENDGIEFHSIIEMWRYILTNILLAL